jgi:hypothetical protein
MGRNETLAHCKHSLGLLTAAEGHRSDLRGGRGRSIVLAVRTSIVSACAPTARSQLVQPTPYPTQPNPTQVANMTRVVHVDMIVGQEHGRRGSGQRGLAGHGIDI